ncbi:MAG TPA: hypothetical protein VHN79_08370, partial [Lacunisphaera sp.]|nr:hypothetical protein [Lacunisphaera sp.]
MSFPFRAFTVLFVSLPSSLLMGAESPAPSGPATPPPPALVPVEGFAVPEGFEITVWAQAPQLRNPTNMDVDAQGRIWVTEGVNYRNH